MYQLSKNIVKRLCISCWRPISCGWKSGTHFSARKLTALKKFTTLEQNFFQYADGATNQRSHFKEAHVNEVSFILEQVVKFTFLFRGWVTYLTMLTILSVLFYVVIVRFSSGQNIMLRLKLQSCGCYIWRRESSWSQWQKQRCWLLNQQYVH